MKDQGDYNVRAVERALQILSSFDDEHPERGVSEIAQLLGLHKATAHRMMVTLLNHGYLERSTDGERYRLGLQVADLGMRVLRRLDLRREARPYMRQLVDQLQETCDLGVFDQGEVFCVEVIHSGRTLTIASQVGQRLPAHCTASGKMFLAFLPAEELDALLARPLRRYTESTICDPAQLRAQLQEIRRLGYGFDDQEHESGVRAISAPIRDRQGKIVATLAMPGPISRIEAAHFPDLGEALMAAANAIARRMGW
ncbi:MAG TPA: IclR family transcriptional regulator [Anaerolineae bacterium]|nr:IclR family transcriptional regulator [Anaerolineae bacterium]HOR00049.1 IclR family transcriptional regulator [Anaerolineae bacterium]HPL28851.1 IclR family transcriptional regulator [Anaerolineae bacterium]